ncbi:hypothetical protein A9W98_13885 [Mycobacterium gordonae]|jgi:hypothetical protein|uniref:Uncharacterized protein n=1 Tax=Mycobacterium gordonae TaxID=1778 RepID=A0A1A6BJV3_MYCGO|nr:hypothetical protein [Mycobacterium gordonae]MBI2698970.1 hypothetical protein [Mycobacterium sp.]OBS02637.1 hypothetical protein A9W98_13885 [Mycobacterium gordonae]
MSRDPDFTLGQRIRVYTGGDQEYGGVIVDDFGDLAGGAVTIGQVRIAEASRRFAIHLDDGRLVFANSTDLRGMTD